MRIFIVLLALLPGFACALSESDCKKLAVFKNVQEQKALIMQLRQVPKAQWDSFMQDNNRALEKQLKERFVRCSAASPK